MLTPKIVEAYKVAKQKLLEQNCKSRNADSSGCAYVSPDGTKRCAVGWILDLDKIILDNIEGIGILANPNNPPLQAVMTSIGVAELPLLDQQFLMSLQMTHDNFEPEEWPSEFAKLEEHYGVSP